MTILARGSRLTLALTRSPSLALLLPERRLWKALLRHSSVLPSSCECRIPNHKPSSKQEHDLTELHRGGKDPAIVCKSANIAKMAREVAVQAFLNSGQICIAVKRIYIHKDIYNEFRDAMVAHVKTLNVGDGMVEGTFVGPIQNSMQYERVQGFFNEIEKQGQKVAVGGTIPDPKEKGYFIQPTIIDNPKEDSKLVIEEPFGKKASII